MDSIKILFICQEITPYLPASEISTICRELPQSAQENGCEIRTFMPKYGCINERRNQLHEVIRLSGMNMIIDDDDHSLIIKVASIQAARMQVYFIDNEEYFRRKFITSDDKGKNFEDNDERCIFFVRGVIETVRKLRWTPDIIHCHGWISLLAPLYIKKAFADDPCFKKSKVVYSIYNETFTHPFKNTFNKKLLLDGITKKDLKDISKNTNYLHLTQLAIRYSDAVIQGSKELGSDIKKAIDESGKPFIVGNKKNNYANYNDFYHKILI